MNRTCRDSGGIVVGWLTKLVVILAVLGIAGFDGLSVVSAHFSGSDDANTAASAAAEDWRFHKNIQTAFDAAQQAITDPSEKLLTKGFVVDSDGTVHLQLQKKINTLVMKSIPGLKKYVVVIINGDAPPPTD